MITFMIIARRCDTSALFVILKRKIQSYTLLNIKKGKFSKRTTFVAIIIKSD